MTCCNVKEQENYFDCIGCQTQIHKNLRSLQSEMLDQCGRSMECKIETKTRQGTNKHMPPTKYRMTAKSLIAFT
eukprot:413685-Hanusia_phi.AAC.2